MNVAKDGLKVQYKKQFIDFFFFFMMHLEASIFISPWSRIKLINSNICHSNISKKISVFDYYTVIREFLNKTTRVNVQKQIEI